MSTTWGETILIMFALVLIIIVATVLRVILVSVLPNWLLSILARKLTAISPIYISKFFSIMRRWTILVLVIFVFKEISGCLTRLERLQNFRNLVWFCFSLGLSVWLLFVYLWSLRRLFNSLSWFFISSISYLMSVLLDGGLCLLHGPAIVATLWLGFLLITDVLFF